MTNHGAVLTALADPTRRAIFERLASSPSAVGDLARQLPVSRPAVSQHLLSGLGRSRRDPRLLRAVLAAVPGQVQGRSKPANTGGHMTTQVQETSVTTQTVVDAPIDHAFRVFTDGIGSWWDPGHHILEAALAEMVFEPRVGGHIIDRGTDGSECRWARVLA